MAEYLRKRSLRTDFSSLPGGESRRLQPSRRAARTDHHSANVAGALGKREAGAAARHLAEHTTVAYEANEVITDLVSEGGDERG